MVLALLFFMAVAWLRPAGRSAAQEEGTQGNLPSQGRGRELRGTQEADLPMAFQATPTPDRLAAPPTVENPNQADEGAQLYWLHCQPCHGDQGQGLTDEWRAQYPPEDQNCWESGCHGNRPYEEGFVLPTAVPPLVGEGSLQRFEHWGEVYGFVQAAMPYQAAGSLEEEEYLAILAFLARGHERWDGTVYNTDNIAAHTIRPAVATPTASSSPVESAPPPPATAPGWPAAILLVVVLAAVGIVLWWRRH